MDLGLEGRVALVAGASRGMGRASALALAREGADVYVLARSAERVASVVGEIRALGRRAEPVVVDVADRAALRGAFQAAITSPTTLGPPVILVLSVAAMYRAQKLQFVEDETIDDLVRTDLVASVDLCKLVLPGMLAARHGRIVAIGSLAARSGVAGATMYAATKAGLEGLVRGIALDYSRRGITANVVAAGFVETERLGERIGTDAEARERLERGTATKALIPPGDVADAIAFLASARAGFITGSVVDVTAGAHLNNLW